jgi:hypothetical protein
MIGEILERIAKLKNSFRDENEDSLTSLEVYH